MISTQAPTNNPTSTPTTSPKSSPTQNQTGTPQPSPTAPELPHLMVFLIIIVASAISVLILRRK